MQRAKTFALVVLGKTCRFTRRGGRGKRSRIKNANKSVLNRRYLQNYGHTLWLKPTSKLFQFNQSILPVAVVSATNCHLFEAKRGIEGSGSRICAGHLKCGPFRSRLRCQPEQSLQHAPSQTLAPVIWMHRHRRDVQLIHHQPGTGQSQQPPPVVPQPNHGPLGFAPLPLPLFF